MHRANHVTNGNDATLSNNPQLEGDRDQRLADLLAQLSDGAQRGEQVNIESVCSEHPDLAAEIRELWGAVLFADVAATQSSHNSYSVVEKTPQTVLELPCRFGDFELIEELGRGGMGVVYRARQISLQREVAIKMILRGDLASTTDIERFHAEAEASAKLEHEGIVPVYEVGDINGRAYFCMKYITGETLSQQLAKGPMPPRKAARILAAVSRAIHFAHQNGVLHRDLKPSNIIVNESGKPLVMDFGLAKQSSETASLTKTGAVIGTPSYMAPEQAAGARGEVGPASDVYSLGSILYHMLTGRPPFQAASPVDTVLMVLEQAPVPVRALNPKADRDLDMIAETCLQKPPDLRYDTAEALADDLEAYLNDEPIAVSSGRFTQIMSRVFRETHNASVLQNWGLLWMWHSAVLLFVCLLTNAMQLMHFTKHWYYIALWTVLFWAWAVVFWKLRSRIGPVTFVERQIAHVWASSMIAIAGLFFVELALGMQVLTLSPVIALISGMVFVIKAGILSGSFYFQAGLLFATSMVMARVPQYGHIIFGVVSASCFFFPGLKYHRQRMHALEATMAPRTD